MNPVLAVVTLAIAGIVRSGPVIDTPATGLELGPLRARTGMVVSTASLEEECRDGAIVVEVGRDRRAFREGHVRGARFLDWHSIAIESPTGVDLPERAKLERAMADLGVGNEDRIVVYSRSVLEATWAWFAFDSLGHGHRVALLDGGWDKWLSEGRPVAGGEFVPRRVEFLPNARHDSRIGMEELKTRLAASLTDRPLVIDARATEEYRGEVTGRSVRRAGHIPGAFSISWTRNLEVIGGLAVFRLPESLRAIYQPGLAAGNSEAVVYCRTGVEASMTYFVLRSLGFKPRLYSGSYVEWSTAPDVPVARTASH